MSKLFLSRSEKGSTVKGRNLLLLPLGSKCLPFRVATLPEGTYCTGTQTESLKRYLAFKNVSEATQENLVEKVQSMLSSLYRSCDHSLSFNV